ncbi:Retrovirus-related Pol polyprotein from transposon TNT 1-94 [Melia azedarach]|uniref:Retrovirus-related Pol polyprotein from transposon TNT 1-94 n=1 Tax=Melia azedarach TaxID=155640 RepID=A0ACC1WUH8_MELAZ|nr:Retrovirus-related Pol polyprotein from transposon TNT 1-94 [Melia azedarach]
MWEVVEKGYNEPRDDVAISVLTQAQIDTLKDSRKRDKKTLYVIYRALDDDAFENISNVTSAKQAWDKLQTSYKGAKQVKKFGHYTFTCRAYNNEEEEKANYVEEKNQGDDIILLAYKDNNGGQENTWYLDTGASNHMCGKRSMFMELDESTNGNVSFGNDSKIAVKGRGHKAIGVKWVYKAKQNSKGEIERYKARLVAKGYSQRAGIDYDEVFTSVARLETVTLIISLAAQNKWKIHQMDENFAFLNGVHEEKVYIQQSTDFEVKGQEKC